MTRSYKPHDLHASGKTLALAAHGFFWTGIERVAQSIGTVARGQMYVEYFIPQRLHQPWPLVMIHGGGGQGTDYLGTPDGREGWVHYFVRQGYAVYVVDRPGLGRSPNHELATGPMSPPAPYEFMQSLFSHPAGNPQAWPQAQLHSQWPGAGTVGDPALDQFLASGGPSIASLEDSHLLAQRAGAELLDRIGPAILFTHSAGSPCGWAIADARPKLIKGIVAIEPLGPPFADHPGLGKLSWGITACKLNYAPAIANSSELQTEVRTPSRPNTLPCLVQTAPARTLPNLQGFPIVVVTAEASWMTLDNHGMVDFLEQAGAQVEHLRLEDIGIHGNGHAMMLEKNSDDIAAALHRWLTQQRLAATD